MHLRTIPHHSKFVSSRFYFSKYRYINMVNDSILRKAMANVPPCKEIWIKNHLTTRTTDQAEHINFKLKYYMYTRRVKIIMLMY
jgi:hypothetical protein